MPRKKPLKKVDDAEIVEEVFNDVNSFKFEVRAETIKDGKGYKLKDGGKVEYNLKGSASALQHTMTTVLLNHPQLISSMARAIAQATDVLTKQANQKKK